MSRIQLNVVFNDRHYDIDAHVEHHIGLTDRLRDRHELFAEIDRSVAKVKAAIKAGE